MRSTGITSPARGLRNKANASSASCRFPSQHLLCAAPVARNSSVFQSEIKDLEKRDNEVDRQPGKLYDSFMTARLRCRSAMRSQRAAIRLSGPRVCTGGLMHARDAHK